MAWKLGFGSEVGLWSKLPCSGGGKRVQETGASKNKAGPWLWRALGRLPPLQLPKCQGKFSGIEGNLWLMRGVSVPSTVPNNS